MVSYHIRCGKLNRLLPVCGLFAAVAVVGEDPGGGIIHVAALPGAVGHPEIPDHPGLAGIVLLEDLPVQQALLGEGRAVVVLLPQGLELGVRVFLLGVGFRSSTMEWPTASEKAAFCRQRMLSGSRCPAQRRGAAGTCPCVGVQLQLGVDAHDVFHEVQVTEGDPGLQGVDGDAPVRPEHVVHVELIHRFLLSAWKPRRWGEVRGTCSRRASSLISPVSSTRTSVRSWMALQHRYIPMLARMVVMSQVPRAAMTMGSAVRTPPGSCRPPCGRRR